MAEYIEREALLQDISETVIFTVRSGVKLPTTEMRGANKVIDRIKSASTADVVEVVCGEWKVHTETEEWLDETFTYFTCSLCERENPLGETEYCPHCGAKMDGKGDAEC